MVARQLPGYRRILIAATSFLLSSCIHAQTVTPRVVIIPTQNGTESGVNIPTNPTSYTYGLRIHGSQARELFTADTYGTSTYPGFYATSSRGTEASPSAVQSGNLLSIFAGGGYDGSNLIRAQGWVAVDAAGNWSPTSRPTSLGFNTTAVGSTTSTRQMTIGSSGIITLSSGSTLFDNSGQLTITGASSVLFPNQALFTAVLPALNNTYDAGNTFLRFLNVWTNNINASSINNPGGGTVTVVGNAVFNGNLTAASGTVTTSSVVPAFGGVYAVGSGGAHYLLGYIDIMNVAAMVANGNTGITTTLSVRDSAGTGICTIGVNVGIIISKSGTC